MTTAVIVTMSGMITVLSAAASIAVFVDTGTAAVPVLNSQQRREDSNTKQVHVNGISHAL